jgi:hypothetical protein
VLLFSLGAGKEVAITSKQWTFPSAALSRLVQKIVCVGAWPGGPCEGGLFRHVGLRALGVSVCVGCAGVGVVRVRCSCWRMSCLSEGAECKARLEGMCDVEQRAMLTHSKFRHLCDVTG